MAKKTVGFLIGGTLFLFCCCCVPLGVGTGFYLNKDSGQSAAPAPRETAEPATVATPAHAAAPAAKPTAVISPGTNEGVVVQLSGNRPQRFPQWGMQPNIETHVNLVLLIVSEASAQAKLNAGKITQYVVVGPADDRNCGEVKASDAALAGIPLMWCEAAQAVVVYPKAYANTASTKKGALQMYGWYGSVVYMQGHHGEYDRAGSACYAGRLLSAYVDLQVMTSAEAHAVLTSFNDAAAAHVDAANKLYAESANRGFAGGSC